MDLDLDSNSDDSSFLDISSLASLSLIPLEQFFKVFVTCTRHFVKACI